jgi:hypothetical protein
MDRRGARRRETAVRLAREPVRDATEKIRYFVEGRAQLSQPADREPEANRHDPLAEFKRLFEQNPWHVLRSRMDRCVIWLFNRSLTPDEFI